jgi:RimJ/RimL family protein N-acetyltransferase
MLPCLPPEPYVFLQGKEVCLEPLQYEHFQALITLGSDARIWEHFPDSRAEKDKHRRYLEESLRLREAGLHHPYVVRLTESNCLAGYTRLHNWDIPNRRVETGSWLHPDFWGKNINIESKWLLLRYVFDDLKVIRVQFRTSPHNTRSRRALEKLGATFEGILRYDRLLPDGRPRDSALYSIIAADWPQVREHLLARMQQYSSSITPPAAA